MPKRQKPRRRKPAKPIILNGVVGVRLSQGLLAWIEPQDWPIVSSHVWCAAEHGHTFYAKTSIDGITVYMHDLIMCPPPGMEVDHFRNPSGLWNFRWNLRVVTHAENMENNRRCIGGRCLQKLLDHSMTTPDERDRRWHEIERRIQEIHAGKVVDGDPAEIEGQLLDEQEAIEFEAGEEYFRKRDAE